MRDEIVRIVARVLELDPAEVAHLHNGNDSHRIGKWTSLKHVALIVELEDHFGVEVDARSLPRLNTVDRILEYLKHAP